jgi:hypothetical protein
LKLGKDDDWLKLTVETDQEFFVTKYGDPPVTEEFELPSSSRATVRVDIAPYFDMSRPGRYRVTASVKVPQLQQEISSEPARVSIIHGTKLWEQEFGLPVRAGAEPGSAEMRKYALVQSMTQKRIRLYVRVSDRYEARNFRVFPIGPLLSFSRPETQVDRLARLHVLFQSGAHAFTYAIVSPDGEWLVRETHQYGATRPALRTDDEGNISVVGGVRVPSSSDLPGPSASEAAPPAPASPGGPPAALPTQPPPKDEPNKPDDSQPPTNKP